MNEKENEVCPVARDGPEDLFVWDGAAEARLEVKQKVLKAIANTYPDLEMECDDQEWRAIMEFKERE